MNTQRPRTVRPAPAPRFPRERERTVTAEELEEDRRRERQALELRHHAALYRGTTLI
jgi:hypothetical protein